MDQAKAGFVATVSFRTQSRSPKESRNAREDFWRPIQERMSSQNQEALQGIEQLENNIVATFPTVLHRVMMQHFQTPSVRANQLVTAHPHELYAVFFGASVEGYGSALLAVDVGGAKELAELFSGNMDTFILLMEAFVPVAFANGIPSDHRGAEFKATIVPTAELSRVFAQTQRSQAPDISGDLVSPASHVESPRGRVDKLPRALVATALSLLTPVILSLIVVYCAAEMLQQDRVELSKREAALISESEDLRRTEQLATADLQRQNLELLRLLRPPAPAASPKP